MQWRPRSSERKPTMPATALRLRMFSVFVGAAFVVIAARLCMLQVLDHRFYAALASNQHGIFEKLFPERGAVYLKDPKSPNGLFPAAVNKTSYVVFADTRDIVDPEGAAKRLAPVLGGDEAAILARLKRERDPYEPLAKRIEEDVVTNVRALDIKGIGFARERQRYYPEKSSLAHVLGFLGASDKGEQAGKYGVEGYWNEELAGRPGFLTAEKDPVGRWIGTASRDLTPARDGDDLVLTIDRTIQYVTCEKLRAAVLRHGADGGSAVVLDPKTGAVLAMCSAPTYDPNDFSKVADVRVFNNSAIFESYEPGSIFKPITMAAAIDAGAVSPTTTYVDEGKVEIGTHTIKNSDGQAHGAQTMTQVLEKSLNTGMIFSVRRLGAEKFLRYVEAFGFGSPTGVELDTEGSGNIESLRKRGDIWSATGSFGQGISVTPMQVATAFGAIANGGKLMKPYVIAEIRHPDGSTVTTEPQEVRQVISKRASTLVGGMLVRVVENGHGKRAAVPGYYVAGKTGTAQIARADGQGYEKDAFVGSFAGYAPVDDPAFVIAVKIVRPRDVDWAESSAAPLFGEIASFLVQYLQIPPERR